MTASNKTIENVLKVILKYVSVENIQPMMEELSKINGNSSFVETIRRLNELSKENHE